MPGPRAYKRPLLLALFGAGSAIHARSGRDRDPGFAVVRRLVRRRPRDPDDPPGGRIQERLDRARATEPDGHEALEAVDVSAGDLALKGASARRPLLETE
jgi:hypothetical protein